MSDPSRVFKRWDIVKLPVDIPGSGKKFRPALVVVAGELFRHHGLLWVIMITSAKNRGWPGDIEVADLAAAGLGVPSIIRTAKITTVAGRDAEIIGALTGLQREQVGVQVFANMGIAAPPAVEDAKPADPPPPSAEGLLPRFFRARRPQPVE
jgi:mRNA interferase MazF